MKKLILVLLFLFLLASTSPAVMVDTRAWTGCQQDEECSVVEGACDWTSVNTAYAKQAEDYYRELQKLVECAEPGNRNPRPKPECRAQKCALQEKPVAKVFDQFIYPSAITAPAEIIDRNRAQMADDEFKLWKADFEIRMLEALIFEKLEKRLLDEMQMNPKAEEIEALVIFLNQKEEARMGELEAQQKDLQAQLQAADLTEIKKKTLSEYLDVTEQLIDNERRRKEEEKNQPNFTAIKKKSLENVATVTVTAWKFNKALYQKYGGRVIFQQAGWEPVDAYKMFLEEHQQAKSFEAVDPDFPNLFQKMFDYFKMDHTYMDAENADKYFAKPWWDPAFEPL